MNEVSRPEVTSRQAYIIAAIAVVIFVLNRVVGAINPDLFKSGSFFKLFVINMVVVGLIVSIVNFRLSLLALIYVAPIAIYYVPGLPFYFTLGDAYLLVLVVVFFIRMITGSEGSIPKTPLDRTIFFFVLLSFLSLINARDIEKGVFELIQTLEYLVFAYYLFTAALHNRITIKAVTDTITLGGTMISAYGIIEYFTNGGGSYRITGTFGNFNAMGAFLAMTTSFIFNLAVSEKDKLKKTMLLICLFTNFVALIMTFSRGSWIGVIIGIVLSAQLKGMVNFVKYFSLAFVLLVILSLTVPTTQYTERFTSISKVSDDASLRRLRQFQIAYDIMTTYPILGVGITSNTDYVYEVYGEPQNAEIHNLFLHIACERGIPAMLLLAWLFISFGLDVIKRISRTDDQFFINLYVALFAAVVSFAAVNFFAYMLIRGPAMYFAILLGLYQAAANVQDHEPKDVEWSKFLSSVNLKRPTMRMGY